MPGIAAIVHSLGGIAQKQQLVARGARDLDLTRAVRRGEVSRARQGWYTTLPHTDLRVRAVRVGGRLTGISAIIQAGGWVLGDHPLHVSVRDNAARLRSQHDRRIRHWVDEACDSLPEGLSRTRLRLCGHTVVSQVRLGSREQIDLLVDDCVGVEVDGEEFHLARFERDRHKDATITIEKFYSFRPSARMVFDEWETVLLAIETAISMHVRAPADGNSGHGASHPPKSPGAVLCRRRWLRRSPEFPNPTEHNVEGRGIARANRRCP